MENINMIENEANMEFCCPMMPCLKCLPCLQEQYIFNEYDTNMGLRKVPAEEIED